MKEHLRLGIIMVIVLYLLETMAFAENQRLATDVLYMRKGEEYVGRLIEVTENNVVFDLAAEGQKTFDLSEVQRVELGKSRPGSTWRTIEDIDDPVLLQAINTSASVDSAYPGAGYITLYKEHAYILHADGSLENTERTIQKVLLERGKRVANGARYYLSKNSKATINFGRTVTADGEVVPISDAAIQDGSVYSDYPDYQNLHKKNWALKKVKEGAIIDYQTTVRKDNIGLLMPFCVDVSFGDNEPVIKEVLKVTVPKKIGCNFNILRFEDGHHSMMEREDAVVYTWTVENRPELIIENFMPVSADIWPRVALAPQASWEELGKAYVAVIDKHLKRDKALNEQIEMLIEGKQAEADKACALYEYIVREIRTIPVPYHLYSLEPKDIIQTYQKKYGNNLDKSLLFLGMLQQAHIPAYLYLIVPQRRGALMDKVPSFGHFTDCLVRINLKDHVVYASVLDDKVPFGALDGEYQHVKGLLVRSDGAQLITTSLMAAQEESEQHTIKVTISEDGTFLVHEETQYTGQSAMELRRLKVMKEEELKKAFQQAVSDVHPNAEMVQYTVSELKNLGVPAGYTLEYRIKDYALRAGETLIAFQIPDLDYTASSVGKSTRTHPLDWTTRTLERNHYTFKIPEGFKIYHIPASLNYDAPFMNYKAEFEQKNGQINFSDAFERIVIQTPASAYPQYKRGIETRAQVTKEWIVLERLSTSEDATEVDTIPPPSTEPVPESGEEDTIKAREILTDVIEAHGGLENLKSVKNMVAKGQLSAKTPGGMMQMEMRQYLIFPDKFRMDMTLQAMGMEISQVFDGQSAWVVTPQGVQPIPESMIEEFKKSIFRDTIRLLTNLSSDDISVQYLGTEEVKGKTTDVILVSNASGDSLKVFIDQETKYIVKKAYRAVTEEGPADTEEFIDDYRDVSGVKNGFHVVIHRNGEQYAEITLSELTINAEVDESLFER